MAMCLRRIRWHCRELFERRPCLAIAVVVTIALLVIFVRSTRTRLSRHWAAHDINRAQLVVLGGERSSGDDSKKSNQHLALKAGAGDTCNIPELNPYHPSVAQFFHKASPLNCRGKPSWVYVEDGKLYFSKEATRQDSSTSTLQCDYEPFWRLTDHKLGSKTFPDVKNGTPLTSDFFGVKCRTSGATFENLYATVLPTKEVLDRAKSKGTPSDWSGLSMYMLGYDSVSHMTFVRKLPKLYKYLTETLEGVALGGYNIVGDGTPQAFIPILTGETEEELPLVRKRFSNANFLDKVYPMIWNEFRDAGYVTAFGEDLGAFGTFTYRLKGFDKQPTDHYMRPFFLRSEKTSQPVQCVGAETQHTVWLRYSEGMFTGYPKSIPKFVLMHHGALSHDDMNAVEHAEPEILAHLERLMNGGHLNSTLLILMADHGHRFSKVRATHQGQLEERLPSFIIVAPKWWREGIGRTAWQNLMINRKRLSSPFDIHPTLQALMHWKTDPGKADLKKRSISLWSEIPKSRTCAQAGIDPHWCTCLGWETANESTDPTVLKAAGAIVQALNEDIFRYGKKCMTLRLQEVVSAQRLVPNSNLLKYKDVKDPDGFVPDLSGDTKIEYALYQLRVRTSPGTGLFETTVKFDHQKFTVDLRTISRINKYGDESHCVYNDPSQGFSILKWCVCPDKA